MRLSLSDSGKLFEFLYPLPHFVVNLFLNERSCSYSSTQVVFPFSGGMDSKALKNEVSFSGIRVVAKRTFLFLHALQVASQILTQSSALVASSVHHTCIMYHTWNIRLKLGN